MRFTTSFLAASALLVTTSASQAGGLSDEIVEAPVEVMEVESPTGSSINGTYVIVGVVAALLLALALREDEEEEEEVIATSDIRLKEDITQIGSTSNGLPLYSFRYIGDTQLYSGVMAQDVLMHTPEAVVMQPNGYLAVNYGMLGIAMEKID
ncbi:tail fiber domain-containing protein [Yoonia sp. BS5-3]|uniref:Tail fiber domain-containing protein n=1 Tax=Yoonia phaeophyticola TaxID=3137369 RepID=A0ABZ2V221_9RHOB